MKELKKWAIDFAQSTITAAFIALLWYILGIDHTWADAANTFGFAFLVMMVLAIYNNMKHQKEE